MNADARRCSAPLIGVNRRESAVPYLGGMRSTRYRLLVRTKFTKWSNFVREAWLIKEKWNKRSCLKPPMNADARRCSAPLIGVDRRPSAVPYPRRYEVCSLFIASEPHTAEKKRNAGKE